MKKFFHSFLISVSVLSFITDRVAAQNEQPLRLAIAGLSHGHVAEAFNASDRDDLRIVGIYEKDEHIMKGNALARKFPGILYSDLDEMLDQTKPEAVMAYGSVFDHLAVVQACAPRGIHVMVEKPMAANLDHALQMCILALQYDILLLTNYETTWYSTNHKAHKMVNEGKVGKVNRINVYAGHEGPIEIGCGPEFVSWLTHPMLNGGGAVMDFGCYGANLATWIMGNQRPVSVYAVLKQMKPDTYPLVDDDATIIVEYPDVTVQIMASWNWPKGRKDMHIYGDKGYIYQDNHRDIRYMWGPHEYEEALTRRRPPFDDPFNYLRAAVRGEITVSPGDLSSMQNNLLVMEILNAAIESARTHQPVYF